MKSHPKPKPHANPGSAWLANPHWRRIVSGVLLLAGSTLFLTAQSVFASWALVPGIPAPPKTTGLLGLRVAHPSSKGAMAFTLIELLVSFAVLSLILVMLLSMTDITSRTWRRTTEKMQAFEEARSAFDRITTLVSQATLNPYWDYDDMENPTRYERTSELQFLSLPMSELGKDVQTYPTHGVFFQAPTGKVGAPAHKGLPLLLNAYGFFIEYGPDDRPTWLPETVSSPKHRFRLKEWRTPAENFTLYEKTSGLTGKDYLDETSTDWIDLTEPEPHALAENVIALVCLPKSTSNAANGAATLMAEPDDFVYNSRTSSTTPEGQLQRHQLPSEIEIIMVAIAESSALREWNNAPTAPSLVDSKWFTEPAQVEANLKSLTDTLTDEGIAFIVLRSTVKLRGSRWSQ